ncbi:MAG: hypothetical protein P8Z31_05370 [Gammaproteobacteria bacterium]|jgi:hypothetical protein
MSKAPFSNKPGRHERHFMRKLDNPLFPRPIIDPSHEEIIEVQRLDHEELLDFVTDLRRLVQQAIELKPNEESQVILDLKAELDKAYEKACTLADEQEGNKQAIQQLINVIMRTIRVNATGDPQAEQQLNEEEQARAFHFSLLEQPIVPDLLDPDSLIEEDELLPCLLSESEEGLSAALELFDEEQRRQLVEQAERLVGALQPPSEVVARLAQLKE